MKDEAEREYVEYVSARLAHLQAHDKDDGHQHADHQQANKAPGAEHHLQPHRQTGTRASRQGPRSHVVFRHLSPNVPSRSCRKGAKAKAYAHAAAGRILVVRPSSGIMALVSSSQPCAEAARGPQIIEYPPGSPGVLPHGLLAREASRPADVRCPAVPGVSWTAFSPATPARLGVPPRLTRRRGGRPRRCGSAPRAARCGGAVR